jgi:hypothetical protein
VFVSFALLVKFFIIELSFIALSTDKVVCASFNQTFGYAGITTLTHLASQVIVFGGFIL